MIYPATFSHAESGKPVVYSGTWTMTLKKTSGHLVFTGSLRVDRPLIVSLRASEALTARKPPLLTVGSGSMSDP
jgi:hypothetical protein